MSKLPPMKTGKQIMERAPRMAKAMEGLSREELIDMALVSFSASGYFLQCVPKLMVAMFRIQLPDLATDYKALADYLEDAAMRDSESLEKKIREDHRDRN